MRNFKISHFVELLFEILNVYLIASFLIMIFGTQIDKVKQICLKILLCRAVPLAFWLTARRFRRAAAAWSLSVFLWSVDRITACSYTGTRALHRWQPALVSSLSSLPIAYERFIIIQRITVDSSFYTIFSVIPSFCKKLQECIIANRIHWS